MVRTSQTYREATAATIDMPKLTRLSGSTAASWAPAAGLAIFDRVRAEWTLDNVRRKAIDTRGNVMQEWSFFPE